jgi:hypothetical protein
MTKHANPFQVYARRRRRLRRDGKKHQNNLKAFVTYINNKLASAVQTLTVTGNAVNAETVTLGAKVYTFQSALTNVDGNVKIGATAALTLINLFNAVNLNTKSGVPGTDYALAMTAHPTILAELVTATTIRFRARTGGTAGNALASTETMTLGSFAAVTLLGGVASFDIRTKMKKYKFRAIKAAVLSTDLP